MVRSGQSRSQSHPRLIARDSTHYARKVTGELVDKADGLTELPRLGRVVPELGDENVREIPAYSYRILYEIKPDDAIVVLAVIHKRRDLGPDEVVQESVELDKGLPLEEVEANEHIGFFPTSGPATGVAWARSG